MLNMALPSGKSLEEPTFQILRDAHIEVRRTPRRHKILFEKGFRWGGTLVRPMDIPKLVDVGEFDMGICGKDAVLETQADVVEVADLEYNRATTNRKAQIVLFAAADDVAKMGWSGEASDCEIFHENLSGAVVLVEYFNCAKKYFEQKKIKVHLVPCAGGAETHVPDRYRFGVCLSESGESLKANGLVAIDTILFSSTVLVASKKAWKEKEKRAAIEEFASLLCGVVAAREKVCLSMNVPARSMEAVLKILPALHTPTVCPLAIQEYFSVTSVVPVAEANELILRLLEAGADGIIEMPISRLMKSGK